MARLKKVHTVEIVGEGLLPIKEASFQPSGEKRDHKAGVRAADGGFLAEEQPAKLKATVLSHNYVDPQALGKLDEVQINVTMQGGQQHIMIAAFAEETPEDKDGEFEITFISNTSEKI